MRVTRRVRILLFVLLAALFAASCGDDGDSGSDDASSTTVADGGDETTTTTAAPKTGGVITMGTYTEPSGLDPVVGTDGDVLRHLPHIGGVCGKPNRWRACGR